MGVNINNPDNTSVTKPLTSPGGEDAGADENGVGSPTFTKIIETISRQYFDNKVYSSLFQPLRNRM